MNALVIGYGSIGSRHARILKELGCPTAVVSNRSIDFSPSFKTLSEALRSAKPSYVVIANKTSEHYPTLRDLKKDGFSGVVMVEKPLFLHQEHFEEKGFEKVVIGYNLRFHPLIQRLKTALREEKVISVQAYVGKYLPEWHSGQDYRRSYSAVKNSGGGVLRDLSHELDYLNWIFEGWSGVAAVGGRYSHLEIDSDDAFSLMMTMERCPMVTLQMNYLDRVSRREILVNTNLHTFKVDLVKGQLEKDNAQENIVVDRDYTYREEHLAVLSKKYGALCSFNEGMNVMHLIETAERAACEKRWIFK